MHQSGGHAARRRQRGAALLLLLVLAGVSASALLVSALSKHQGSLERARELKTLVTLSRAKEALIGYALRYGRLPRPAISAVDGTEAAGCDSEASCSGLLPWVTLGIDGSDSWNKILRYSVTPQFTRAPIRILSAVGSKVVLQRDGHGQIQYLAGQDVCNLSRQCPAAVIFSNGKNNLGISTGGVRLPNAALGNIDEIQNDGGITQFYSRPQTDDPQAAGGEFDDLVTWITLPTLFRQMTKVGALP